MLNSVRALLNQIIDYAGLFPPAKLPLEEALANYLRVKKSSPYAWMLGRFVCPTARLPELLALAKIHPHAGRLSVTALGQQSSAPTEYYTTLTADIGAVQKFRADWGTDIICDLIEIPLPKHEAADMFLVGKCVSGSVLRFGRAGSGLRGFFEVPRSDHWRQDLDEIVPATSEAGLKLRCGGVTADAFPSEADIAFFIDRCRRALSPWAWKATAGLHHPCRHWDAHLKVWHHGFLNVFIAGLLAQVHSLTESDIVEILADRNGAHFRFDDDSLGWKNWSCTTQQIIELRATRVTTFGSCSFEEPCADLLAMGLLD